MKNNMPLRAFLLLFTAGVLLAVIPGEQALAASGSSSAGPEITLIPSSGHVGDNIQMTGDGFGHDQNIIVRIDGSSILSYITGWDGVLPIMTDDEGSFGAHPPARVVDHVPNIPGGVHVVTAQDDAGNTASANVTVLPKINVSVLRGAAGAQVNAAGSGLQANAALSVSFNGLSVAATRTDALGAFTQGFTVPAVQNGSYDIKITDSTTTQDFSFSVEGNAPIAPGQMSPDSGKAVSLPLSFSWSYPANPEITYELQVSADPGFDSTILDKTDITAQSYTISNIVNAAGGSLCYWRVRAVYLGNEARGNWSATGTFRLSSSHSYGITVILTSLAIIALAVVCFFIIRLKKHAV